MNLKELANKLNNCEYRNGVSSELIDQASINNLVIVHGYSDDNMEFQGAIDDELGCYGGGVAYLNKDGIIHNECDEENCPYYKESLIQAKKIKAIWNKEGYSWIYETDIPHETFDILDDGEKYCRGIVFSLDNLE